MTRSQAWIARLLLAASLALGLAHIALLPPFEGADETAHYSSILQIADAGEIPVLGRARMAEETETYARRGPMPYGQARDEAQTYRGFFAGGLEPRGLDPSPPFAPSTTPNWQAQHPPLYYLLLAPVAKLTAGQALRDRLFWLRAFSYLLAFVSLCLAARVNGRWITGGAFATALWPLLLPQWFPEMARLGNDSLACLLLTLAWGGFLAVRRQPQSRSAWLLLGLWFGLGMLTKGYVIPVALAAFAYLGATETRRAARLAIPAAGLLLMLAIGLPWYGWLALQGIPAANDSIALAQGGGMLAGLAQHWSLSDFLYSLGSIAKSFVWGGSWSFARPPELFYLPLFMLGAVLIAGWLIAGRRAMRSIVLPPLVFLLPMLAGLAGQSLLWLALGQKGVTGGWYLHVLIGPLAFMLASGWQALGESRSGLIARNTALLYALAFGAGTAWMQAGLFAGCVTLAPGGADYAADWSCAFDAPLVWQRLSLIAEPGIGAAAFMLGALLLIATGLAARRNSFE